MGQSRVRPTVEGGILSAIAILFALISVYIPFLGVFVNFIWPVPIILLGVRHGYKWSIMATVVSGMLIAILVHPLTAIGVAIGFGLTGIMLGHCFRKKFSPVSTLMLGAVASLVSKIIVLGISAAVMGINPLSDHSEAMNRAFEQALSIYRTFGMKEDELAKISENLRSMLELMKVILPAGFLLASVVDTFLNMMVARVVLGKLGHAIEKFPPFKEWRFPTLVIYAFIIAILMLYWGKSRDIPLLADAGLNLQVISSMLLMIHGLSVAFFYAAKYEIPKILRWVLIFMVFTNGFILQATVFAGAFDIAFDFRKLKLAKTNQEE